MRNINQIIVHCSATPPEMDIGVNEIRSWHKQRGWSDIGYHYVIRRDGLPETGRPESRAGAHARGFNKHSIGVCLVGGVGSRSKPAGSNTGKNMGGKPDANFTAAQYDALAKLLRDLKHRFPDAKIIGHRDVSAKACPSFDIHEFVRGEGI